MVAGRPGARGRTCRLRGCWRHRCMAKRRGPAWAPPHSSNPPHSQLSTSPIPPAPSQPVPPPPFPPTHQSVHHACQAVHLGHHALPRQRRHVAPAEGATLPCGQQQRQKAHEIGGEHRSSSVQAWRGRSIGRACQRQQQLPHGLWQKGGNSSRTRRPRFHSDRRNAVVRAHDCAPSGTLRGAPTTTSSRCAAARSSPASTTSPDSVSASPKDPMRSRPSGSTSTLLGDRAGGRTARPAACTARRAADSCVEGEEGPGDVLVIGVTAQHSPVWQLRCGCA
jgi:hypothetical protein